jgi:hypothetical protein
VGPLVECIVDRYASPRAPLFISRHHRVAAAVGQNQVVGWNEGSEGVVRCCLDAFQCGRRIHIPEDHPALLTFELEHGALKKIIEHPHSAGLNDDIGGPGILQGRAHPLLPFGAVHMDRGVFGIGDVPMVLAVEGVRFVKSDAMPQVVEGADDAAIIGGGTVPIGRHETGAEKSDRKGTILHVFSYIVCAVPIQPTAVDIDLLNLRAPEPLRRGL